MSEKFNLKWNDYQSNWNRSLSELRNDSDLADVTLITDDKEKFYAHKIVLSSCSNMFKFILKGSNHANPLLYLVGVNSVNLGFILDYIYCGEVNLLQEQLDSFLESAQKLEIEGLMGQESMVQDQETSYENKIEQEEKIVFPLAEAEQEVRINDNVISRRQYARPPISDVAKIDVTSLAPEEKEEKRKELYTKIDGVWTCTACDYTTHDTSNIKRHVEIHIIGLSYSCINILYIRFDFQDKKFFNCAHKKLSQIIFRNIQSLQNHLARNHQRQTK